MRRWWRFQFGLRTLLLAMILLGIAPWLAVKYVRWREDQVWRRYDYARSMRDQTLAEWRIVNDEITAGNAELLAEAEADARDRYFSYRAQTESALREVHRHYGGSDEELNAAIERRATRKAAARKLTFRRMD